MASTRAIVVMLAAAYALAHAADVVISDSDGHGGDGVTVLESGFADPQAYERALTCLRSANAPTVLAGVRDLTRTSSIDERGLAALRPLIADRRHAVARAAIAAVAVLHDSDAIPQLVAALTRAEADDARTALRSFAGRDLGPAPDAWTGWFESHRAAADAALTSLRAGLAEPDAARVVEAVHGLLLADVDAQVKLEALAPLANDQRVPVAQSAQEAIAALQRRASDARGENYERAVSRSERTGPDRLVIAPDGTAVVATAIVPATASIVLPSHRIYVFIGLAVLVGCVGSLGLLVFLMRTRESAIKLTKRIGRRVRTATIAINKSIKKRITFTS